MGTILAADVGKFKSVCCWFAGSAETARFQTVPTEREEVRMVVTKEKMDLVPTFNLKPAG